MTWPRYAPTSTNTMIGVDMARTQSRVRAVIEHNSQLPTPQRPSSTRDLPRNRNLPRLEPLYGIRWFTVDPELEIQGRRPGGRGAHAPDFSARFHDRASGYH